MSTQTHTTPTRVRAFTLLEILLAIFILGIGVISIASLFPAGIVQQRMSIDDSIAPLVANNAIEIIRAKLKREYFGTFEDFTAVAPPKATIRGDWPWLRPAVMTVDDPSTVNSYGDRADDTGAIDIFCSYHLTPPLIHQKSEFPGGYQGSTTPKLYGIPYNFTRYGSNPPRVLIPRQERCYPMVSKAYVPYQTADQPQYMWDCMFRRFQGKILVAIFVYRANMPGGGSVANSLANGSALLPMQLQLGDHGLAKWNAELGTLPPPGGGGGPPTGPTNQTGPGPAPGPGGPPDHGGGVTSNQTGTLLDPILGKADSYVFNPNEPSQAWMEPRQWVLDQNNNIHRVAGTWREANGEPLRIELVRPVAAMPAIPAYYLPGDPKSTNSVIDTIWYMPLNINGVSITPVYVTVKEL